MDDPATLATYRWVEDFDALTVALIAYSGPVSDVLRASGNKWSPAGRATFRSEVVWVFDDVLEPTLVDRSGPWLVFLAPNGFEFSFPGVAAGASRLGRVVSLFWNVKGHAQVLVADGGHVIRRFDPVIPEDAAGDPLAEENGLPFGIPGEPLRAAALVLAERLTGRRLSKAWILEEHDLLMITRRTWAAADRNCTAMVPLDTRE
jgi:hypothetical protein